uniref:Reverse transcriptase Ty1/copia-type domain-containing protein n=1 Tax=Steinernema glaseri TaxID=37863 RepID=A0A1I8ACF4_9BILA
MLQHKAKTMQIDMDSKRHVKDTALFSGVLLVAKLVDIVMVTTESMIRAIYENNYEIMKDLSKKQPFLQCGTPPHRTSWFGFVSYFTLVEERRLPFKIFQELELLLSIATYTDSSKYPL